MKQKIKEMAQRQDQSVSLVGLLASGLLLVMLTGCSGGGSASGNGGDGTTPVIPSAGFLNVDPATPITQAITNLDTQDRITQTEISEDTNGRRIVRTKIELIFRSTITAGEVKRVLAAFSATPTSAIGGTPSIVVRIPDPGSLAALDALVAQIESDPAIWFVEKANFPEVSELPPDYPEVIPPRSVTNPVHPQATGLLGRLAPQLTVHASGAWNAREALKRFAQTNRPSVVVFDHFGNGAPSVDDLGAIVLRNEDFALTPTDGHVFGTNPRDGHGYHVLGIIAGTFAGLPGSLDRGLVTGLMPGVVRLRAQDQEGIDPLTALNLLLRGINASSLGLDLIPAIPGMVIVNESLGDHCERPLTPPNCVNPDRVGRKAVNWIRKVRAIRDAQGVSLEGRVLHILSAGNNDTLDSTGTLPTTMEAKSNGAAQAAALRNNLTDDAGNHVDPLTNTLVIENDGNTTGAAGPFVSECLSRFSYTGGHLGAIGTNVWSFIDAGTYAGYKTGTSMAAPQVSGLAAYLLGLQPSLTVQQLKSILLTTARPVPTSSASYCADPSVSPAKIIDAYAAVLALDAPAAFTTNNPSLAPIRRAILDVANNDGRFTEADLTVWVDKLITNVSTPALLDYSRYDLNGDGYTGGPMAPFDLDISYPNPPSQVTQTINGLSRQFNEEALTDLNVLCYYAYSPLYEGDTTRRDDLLRLPCATAKIKTVAGTGVRGFSGDGGPAINANLSSYLGENSMAVDSFGNIYFIDTSNATQSRIRRVDATTGLISTALGTANLCDPISFSFRQFSCLGAGTDLSNGRWVTDMILIGSPHAVAVNAAGDIYFCPVTHSCFRKDMASGYVYLAIGSVADSTGVLRESLVGIPILTSDNAGNLFLASDPRFLPSQFPGCLGCQDPPLYVVRKKTPTSPLPITIAGTGVMGFSGDNGPAISAQISFGPVAVDGKGNVYIGDSSTFRVRKVDATTGVITTVAGNGIEGFSGDGGLAINASIRGAAYMAVDGAGNIYINGARLRRVDAVTGIITTIAGNGIPGFSGDNGPAIDAQIAGGPIAVDKAGNVYILESQTRIRKIEW